MDEGSSLSPFQRFPGRVFEAVEGGGMMKVPTNIVMEATRERKEYGG